MPIPRDHAAMEARRRAAARLFGRDVPTAEVARQLGVARQVAYRWRSAWERGGVAALASRGAAGRKPRLTPEQLRRVAKALAAPPATRADAPAGWTLPRIADLIEEVTGERFHPGHVWRLVRDYGLGRSPAKARSPSAGNPPRSSPAPVQSSAR